MTGRALNRLRPSSVITDNIDMIIDGFVDYYGEDRREEITNTLKNALILKVINNWNLGLGIHAVKRGLAEEFLGRGAEDELPIDLDELYESLNSEIFQFCYISPSAKELLTGSRDISDEELYDGYKKGLFPKLDEFVKAYKPIKEEIDAYDKEHKENKERIKEAEFICYKMLVDEFRYLVPDEDYEKFLQDKEPTAKMIGFFHSDLRLDGNCFDQDAEDTLNNSEYKWIKESIIEDRLEMVYAMYSRNPNNPKRLITYDDFLNDPELKVYIDEARETCQKIEEKRKSLKAIFYMSLTAALADYHRNKKLKDEYDFVCDTGLGPMAYTSGCSYYSANFVRTENGIEYKPIIVVNSSSMDLDETLIHELNHLIEARIYNIDEEGYTVCGGWDYYRNQFKGVEDNSDPSYQGIARPYELLAEFVNERIAEEIVELMRSKGHYIFSPTPNYGSRYLSVKNLFEDFFQNNKPAIIESRKGNNVAHLYEAIGKENFEELNSIANDFYKEFNLDWELLDKYEKRKQGLLESDDESKVKDAKLDILFERKEKVMQAIENYKKEKGDNHEL